MNRAIREYRAAARAGEERQRFFKDSEIFCAQARMVIWFVVLCMTACAVVSVLS